MVHAAQTAESLLCGGRSISKAEYQVVPSLLPGQAPTHEIQLQTANTGVKVSFKELGNIFTLVDVGFIDFPCRCDAEIKSRVKSLGAGLSDFIASDPNYSPPGSCNWNSAGWPGRGRVGVLINRSRSGRKAGFFRGVSLSRADARSIRLSRSRTFLLGGSSRIVWPRAQCFIFRVAIVRGCHGGGGTECRSAGSARAGAASGFFGGRLFFCALFACRQTTTATAAAASVGQVSGCFSAEIQPCFVHSGRRRRSHARLPHSARQSGASGVCQLRVQRLVAHVLLQHLR